MSIDLNCEHGTLLAAWCAECAVEWVPETVDAPTADRGQSAA
ncbi:MAG: hypothetical protein QOJ11_3886 [Frankiales bacterium]|jgi:hypothetical protein|nr:hypothetical protein [Frankiales bacterium]